MFDRIVVVDWSASGTPTLGPDSIWIATLDVPTGDREVVNHPTRVAARDALATSLAAPRRTLLGVDFSLGLPTGFARAAGLSAPQWSAVWAHLAASLHDDDRNRNDRWAVAAEWNRALGRTHFWGVPGSAASEFLTPTRPPWTADHLPAFRITEERLRADGRRPFSVWQLLGAGSVGSQTLTGLPVLHHLRHHPSLRHRMRVWPFETGFAAPLAADVDDAIVVAEVWPSAIPFAHVSHPVKDARQVIALADHVAQIDARGELDVQFAPLLSDDEAAAVISEEGWVLGVP